MSHLNELVAWCDRNGGAHLSIDRTTHGSWLGRVVAIDMGPDDVRVSWDVHRVAGSAENLAQALLDALDQPGKPVPDHDHILQEDA